MIPSLDNKKSKPLVPSFSQVVPASSQGQDVPVQPGKMMRPGVSLTLTESAQALYVQHNRVCHVGERLAE